MSNWRRGSKRWTKKRKKLITLKTKDETLNAQTELTALKARNVALNAKKMAMNAWPDRMMALNIKLERIVTLNTKLEMWLWMSNWKHESEHQTENIWRLWTPNWELIPPNVKLRRTTLNIVTEKWWWPWTLSCKEMVALNVKTENWYLWMWNWEGRLWTS